MTPPGRAGRENDRRVRVTVRGRVQGVSYRASTAREARALGLLGWVRNRPDGTVELLAQGAAGDVERLIAWARQGPPAARVDALDLVEERPTEDLHAFEVLR
jgi:acylphosphatase